MVVHVDQVKVDEAAPRPPGPHGDVQVLHRMRRQRKHTPGVRLGTAGEAGWEAAPALCRPQVPRHPQPRPQGDPQGSPSYSGVGGATWPARGQEGPE